MPSETLADFTKSARARVLAGFYDRMPPGAADPPRSLAASLRRARGIVAEVKPASPSAGRLRADVDAGALARSFAAAGALGVSALVEPERFGGSLENVRAAASANLPVLFKDFLVDPRQIAAARAWGASLVLAIPEILDGPEETRAMIDAAHAAGLEVLLEVYDAQGFAAAQKTRADIIGVNNRDLRRPGLPVDVGTTARAISGAKRDRPVLALSGIESAADVRAMFDAGASGVLIGTTLMRAADPADALRTLQKEIA